MGQRIVAGLLLLVAIVIALAFIIWHLLREDPDGPTTEDTGPTTNGASVTTPENKEEEKTVERTTEKTLPRTGGFFE